MIDGDRQRFASLMTGWADYYRTPLSSMTLDIYWNLLRHYDIDAIDQALRRHAMRPDREGAFMPKANEIGIMLEGRSANQAAAAWAKVDRAIRTRGPYYDVVFDESLIHTVIAEMGGWAWLGNQTDKEWPFVEKRFCVMYQGYRMRGEQPPHTGILTGIANAHNDASGHPRLPPVMVGDPARCEIVARGGQAQLGKSSRVPLSLEAS